MDYIIELLLDNEIYKKNNCLTMDFIIELLLENEIY